MPEQPQVESSVDEVAALDLDSVHDDDVHDVGSPPESPVQRLPATSTAGPARGPTLREIVQLRRTGDVTPASPAPAQRAPLYRAIDLSASAPVQQQGADAPDEVPSTGHVHAAAAAGIATPSVELPHRDQLEGAFGQDLSSVKAHVGGDAHDASRAMGAEAFASGDHVVFGEAPSLHTAAHEVAHVMQQRHGEVQLAGGVGELGDPYERDADAVADSVVGGDSVAGRFSRPGGNAPPTTIQRQPLAGAAPSGDLPPGFEVSIKGILEIDVVKGDLEGAQTRVKLLQAHFRALHRAQRRSLLERLHEAEGDDLSRLFHYKLATGERQRALAVLRDETPAATEKAPAAAAAGEADARAVTGAEPEATTHVLHSSDPAVNGRPVQDVGTELKAKAQSYARLIVQTQEYAGRNKKDEQRVLDEHSGLIGRAINLFNADPPDPERWASIITDWAVVMTCLTQALTTPATPETINQLGGSVERGLQMWEAAMERTQMSSDAFLTYLHGFSHAAVRVNGYVELSREIVVAGAVAVAVVALAPVVGGVIGAYAAGAAGLTGAAATGAVVISTGASAAAIGSGLKAAAWLGVESANQLSIEMIGHGKNLADAAEGFDWGAVRGKGVHGLKTGWIDGVMAVSGAGVEGVLSRAVGGPVGRALSGQAGTLFTHILRRAGQRAVSAGVAGGISGALDAGARAAIDGRPWPEILAAMETGAKYGAGAGAIVGVGAGGREILGAARLDKQAAELAELYARDTAQFTAQYHKLAAELDPNQLRELMANVRVRQAPTNAGAIEQGSDRVRELHTDYAFDDASYHGTSSDVMDGLQATDGQVLSAAELKRRRIAQKSGEGEAYSGEGGLKEDISIGHGESGLGTSLAYADAAESLRHYNPQLLTWDDLNAQIRELQDSLGTFGKLNVSLPESGFYRNARKRQSQFEEKLAKLRTELSHRLKLPMSHPRRLGGPQAAENYPLMFEFDSAGLAVEHRRGVKAGGALGGEASVTGAIDLRTRVRRVYAPAEHVPEVTARFRKILGHGDFEVIPLESVDAIPAGGLSDSSRVATYKNLETLEKEFDAAQRTYAHGARTGEDVDIIKFLTELNKQ